MFVVYKYPDMYILVVDDEKDVRNSLRDVLNMAGYDVITASGGREAMEFIDKEDIGVMLVDLSMPEMSGEDLLLSLEHLNKRPPALVITAMAPWKTLKLIDYGVGYIRKPINNELLLGAIKTLIRKEGNGELKGSC
jgi:DNA-binding response OmpR family regulator